MKHKLLSVLLSLTLLFVLAACGETKPAEEVKEDTAEEVVEESAEDAEEPAEDAEEPAEDAEEPAAKSGDVDLSTLDGKKIGITIQSLENAYWAGVMSALEDVLTEAGAEYTIVDCKDNSATQISQVENFISAGVDLIMMHPSDAAALEDVSAEAKEAGVRVMCWDDPMENTDANWVLDNTVLGKAIGTLAGNFINEHFTEDEPAKVAVIGYPQTKVLLERANGIKEGLEETADGKYEIVAEQEGIEVPQAQASVETILVKYPDLNVVAGVGAGAMIGSNEALVTHLGNDIPENVGIFTTDVTKQQLEGLLADTAIKGIIGFEGSDFDTARACANMYARILNGEFDGADADAKIVYREIGEITADNVQEIIDGMK